MDIFIHGAVNSQQLSTNAYRQDNRTFKGTNPSRHQTAFLGLDGLNVNCGQRSVAASQFGTLPALVLSTHVQKEPRQPDCNRKMKTHVAHAP